MAYSKSKYAIGSQSSILGTLLENALETNKSSSKPSKSKPSLAAPETIFLSISMSFILLFCSVNIELSLLYSFLCS